MNEFDERYSTAEEAIFDSFFLLLREKDIDKITVSDVVKKAGIVRSTFYNHYENVPALVNAAEEKTIENIFSLMESFHPKDDKEFCKSFFLAICNYTRENPFLSTLLNSTREDAFFEKMLLMFDRYMRKVTDDESYHIGNRKNATYFIAASIGSTIGVLHKWSTENFEASEDEIADIMTQAFISGVLPGLSTK
ncbi:MAG: TetR/AcrR family transcriptional regulator [Butyrivibrio sp.]|nr:TetR/AcrR family transcriptional regulator [Butyrivibrio sp.]